MPLTAILLVLGAGFLHASWNLILKRTSERLLVTSWGLLIGAIVFVPALLSAWPPPARVWPYAVCSALTLVAYYTCLARAYEHGDFSLVYPVARGTAPAMLAVWAIIFLGERPSPVGLLGIVAILGGLVVLGGAPLWSLRDGTSVRQTLRTHARGSGFAFLVALLVSIYTAIDGGAIRHWSPLPYLVVVFALSGGDAHLPAGTSRREACASSPADALGAHRGHRGDDAGRVLAGAQRLPDRAGQLRGGGPRDRHRLRRARGMAAPG